MTIDPGIKLLIVDDLPENLLALEASIRARLPWSGRIRLASSARIRVSSSR